MALRKAIILAGGKGTRIRTVEGKTPKSLIQVTDKPILFYILQHLKHYGFEEFIFSLGYGYDEIIEYLDQTFPKSKFSYVIENTPHGTGGALRYSFEQSEVETYLVVNGDTFVNYDINDFVNFHLRSDQKFSLVAVSVDQSERYGFLTFQGELITNFLEKGNQQNGWINAGHYLINSSLFASMMTDFGYETSEKFSLEEFMERAAIWLRLRGFKTHADFIDIGVPDDLEFARRQFIWPN